MKVKTRVMLESSQSLLKQHWSHFSAQDRLDMTVRRVQRGREGQVKGQAKAEHNSGMLDLDELY